MVSIVSASSHLEGKSIKYKITDVRHNTARADAEGAMLGVASPSTATGGGRSAVAVLPLVEQVLLVVLG